MRLPLLCFGQGSSYSLHRDTRELFISFRLLHGRKPTPLGATHNRDNRNNQMKQLKAKILCAVVAVLVMASAQTNHNTSATEKNSNLQSTNSVESHTKGEYASVNKAEAVNTLRVAESGNARAQNELGKYYANRNGGVTNIDASAKVATDPKRKESADRNIISYQERVAAAERALKRGAATYPTLDAPREAQVDTVRRASEVKRMVNEETAAKVHATNPSKFPEKLILVFCALGGLLLKSRSTLLKIIGGIVVIVLWVVLVRSCTDAKREGMARTRNGYLSQMDDTAEHTAPTNTAAMPTPCSTDGISP